MTLLSAQRTIQYSIEDDLVVSNHCPERGTHSSNVEDEGDSTVKGHPKHEDGAQSEEYQKLPSAPKSDIVPVHGRVAGSRMSVFWR
jgi:hypothetical protein